MPQINRVRIINFSYNNHNRNILDETFDFFQGENALLSLKNGGGKSVLVQLLLQPIIPKTKLMSRKIEDFFREKKTPAYILIEWKLEDQGGYLLTGIGLTNRDSLVREQDDSNNSIKYFTFTSHYRESNLFDIENVPLIRRLNEKILIEHFKDARKLLVSKEKESGSTIKVFTDEDGLDYKRHLETFNIFQDEWKSIILKINESEGGVIEIFEKCKTSQQLMNDWILTSIEKVVNKEERDQKKLEQMLENLVEEMISNEQFIYEKELYQEFLDKTEDFLTKLNELTNSIDEENNKESCLARMYYFLKKEIEKRNEEINRLHDKMTSGKNELKKIDLEERSKTYYDELENVKALTFSLTEEGNNLDQVKNQIEKNDTEVLIQKAAREYGYVTRLKAKIAGINEEINKIKSNEDNNEKIRNLEYSLKLAYEELLEELTEKESILLDQLKKNNTAAQECDTKITELDGENSKFQSLKGSVQSKIEQFESRETRICSELGFDYERNLLGEIDRDYFKQYFQFLEQNVSDLAAENSNHLIEIEKQKQETTKLKNQVISLRKMETEYAVQDSVIDSKIGRYNELEQSLKPALERYDIDFARRFHSQENLLHVKNIMDGLQKTERALNLNCHTLSETIASLKDGTLHVSKEFAQWLINQDIEFETGENYLRNHEESIRHSLVQNNPILPFAFILYDDDLKKLMTMEITCKTHQMVPILSHNNLTETYSIQGNTVYVGDKLQLLCLYDNKMIDADNLEGYLEELKTELKQENDRLEHYRNQLDAAREDRLLMKQFDFDKNYLYELECEKTTLQERIKTVKADINEFEVQQSLIADNISALHTRITEIKSLVEKAEERQNRAQEFVKANKEYIENLRSELEYSSLIENIAKQKEALKVEKNRLNEERDTLVSERLLIVNDINDKSSEYEFFKSAPEATQLEEDIEIMKSRLQALKSRLTGDIKRLEEDLTEKKKELKEKQDLLMSYQLVESQYADVNYQASKLSNLEMKGKDLKREYEEIDQHQRKLEGYVSAAKAKLENAEAEVKKLAEGPLDQSEIKLNFATRRNNENKSIDGMAIAIRKLDSESKHYEKYSVRIEGKINVSKHEVDARYEISKTIDNDYLALVNELEILIKANNVLEKNINNQYNGIKAKYGSKNKHIENILVGLEPLIAGATSDKNKYYYLGERMLQSNESLRMLVKACEQRLTNLEKNKKDMIQHSYLHGKQVFDEVQKIAENSSIKIDGKNRPIPMLKINMEPLSEIEEDNSNKMKSYIENCVAIIKNDMKEDKKIDEIRKKISKYMSTKELLNVLSDLGKLKISAYKIDLNIKNSTYKSWEQVMKENSGGERFVSFFAVLVALMSYTRTSMKIEDDYQRNRDTKVLIMDNPFGPISSEHLLKPLFKIASKYHTQLICLTDLKQNSILNCFNLIYIIKIRQNVLGTNEYIQLEQQIKADGIIERDEKLEKAVFKAVEVDQISLF